MAPPQPLNLAGLQQAQQEQQKLQQETMRQQQQAFQQEQQRQQEQQIFEQYRQQAAFHQEQQRQQQVFAQEQHRQQQLHLQQQQQHAASASTSGQDQASRQSKSFYSCTQVKYKKGNPQIPAFWQTQAHCKGRKRGLRASIGRCRAFWGMRRWARGTLAASALARSQVEF